MQPASYFETLTKRSVVIQAKIETFVSDLRRLSQMLEAEIKTEEERANVSDCRKASYPDVARRLRLRRDNLLATIALMEGD